MPIIIPDIQGKSFNKSFVLDQRQLVYVKSNYIIVSAILGKKNEHVGIGIKNTMIYTL